MNTLDAHAFANHVRQQWAPAGFQVSEITDAPYKELVAAKDGWSFGVTVAANDNLERKTRIGVWLRPAPRGSVNDLAALRTHYQQKLAQQRRGSRIQSCNLPVGPVFLFFETTAQLAESSVSEWVAMCEELTALAFDADSLDALLGVTE
jgi:hypothetical protein